MRRLFHLGLTILPCLALACGGSTSDGTESPGTSGAGAAPPSDAGASSGGTAASTGGSSGSGTTAGSGANPATGGNGASGAGQGGTSSAGTAGDAPLSSVELEGTPIYTRVQRLTNSQWERAVTDVLRLGAPANLSRNFSLPVAGTTDFTNNEKLLFVDETTFVDYELASEAAAALATSSPEALGALYEGTDGEGFVRTFGRRAFRRPLTPEEEQSYLAIFARGEMLYGPGFANGAALVIRAMLQSPHFLYRTELGAAGEPLNGYEAAAKLSFWLRGTTPSEELLDSAAAGDLDSVEGLEALARQMLEEPAARDVMRDFHAQLHELGRYAVVSKPAVPEYSDALNPELAESSALFFDHVFQEELGLREILTSTQAFVGPGLAALYGIDAPAAGYEQRDLGASRLGYFMQIPFLLLHGVNRDPDPIRRGLALHRDVLCAGLPAPESAPAPPPPALEGQTNRERITALTASCGGECHALWMDPLGFAFEDFDGMGQPRELDNGQPIDTTSSYPFSDGVREFADASELMQILADSPQAHLCYSKKLVGYSLQRDVVESDRPLLEALAEVSSLDAVKEIMVSLVKDPAFRLRQEGTP